MKTPTFSRASRLGALSLLVLALGAGGASLLTPKHAETSSSGGESGGTGAIGRSATPSRLDRARGPGLRRTYTTKLEQHVALTSGTSSGSDATVKILLTGRLDLAFVGHDGGKHRLFAELADVRLAIGSGAPPAEAAAVEQELARPFYVVTEADGRVRGYAFAKGVSPMAQNLLRGVLASGQVSVRDEASWTAQEDDVQGTYTATYTKGEAGALVKTKAAPNGADGMGKRELRARGVATIADDGWPRTLVFDEHQVVAMGKDMPVATTDLHLTMTLEGTRQDLALLGRYEQELGDLVVAGTTGTADDGESSRIADARLVGGATATELLADARRATDDAAAIAAGDKLAARLRLTPEDAASVAAMAKTLPVREGNVALGALGGAATKEATKALGQLVVDAKATPALRANAATQLAFATGSNAVEAREALSQGLSDPSREVRDSSALALGNVARELGDADGDTVQDLLRRYGAARDDEERAMLLHALGNSGSADILPVVRLALGSESEAVREAAAQALRFLPVGEADAVLGRVLGQEPSQTVVVSAIDAIGFRIVEMHAKGLDRAIGADTSGRVRGAVAEIVQRALSTRKDTLSAEARAILQALLARARTEAN